MKLSRRNSKFFNITDKPAITLLTIRNIQLSSIYIYVFQHVSLKTDSFVTEIHLASNTSIIRIFVHVA